MLANKLGMALLIFVAWVGAISAADKPAGTDWYGDPLPPGALARLGTSRLRHIWPSVIFSPDGQELISAGEDGMVRFWDSATGKEKHRVRVQSADGSGRPSAFASDGKSVAGTSSKYLHVWDVATGKEVKHFRLEGSYWQIALSQDGKKLAALTYQDPHVYLWEVSTGKKLRKLKAWAFHNQLVFSPDGKLLGVVDQSNGLYLWDTATGKEVRHIAEARNLIFSPDGKRAATVTQAGGVTAWSLADGKDCWNIQPMPGLHPVFLRFSADAKKPAIGIYRKRKEGKELIWDFAAGKSICSIPVGNQTLLSPDGKIAASFSVDSAAIHLWDAATGKEIAARASHESGAGFAVAQDGSTIATFDAHKVYLWDTSTGRPILQLPEHKSLSQAMFSPDGRFLVTGGFGENILHVWDRKNGKEARRFLLESSDSKPQTAGVRALAFSSDGERLISLDADWQLLVREFATGRILGRRTDVSIGTVSRFSVDARSMAYGTNAGVVAVKDVATGQEMVAIKGFEPLAFSPDGQILAVANRAPKPRESNINVIDLIELASGKRLLRIDARPDGFEHLAYSPDGGTLATVDNNRFRIWDAATGKELFRRELPVKYCRRISYSFCHSLAFLPSGDRLATALADSTTLIWDLQPKSWRAGIVVKNLERRDLERLGSDLAGEDAAQAHRAVWTLAADPDKAIPFLKEHLHPAPPPDAKLVQSLIADLDSPEFAIRERANKKLASFGEQAEPALRQALARKPSLEARRRLEWLHKDATAAMCGVVRSAERLRVLRAIRALEQIGDRESRQLLHTLAGGAAGARQTRMANEALHRLEQRAALLGRR